MKTVCIILLTLIPMLAACGNSEGGGLVLGKCELGHDPEAMHIIHGVQRAYPDAGILAIPIVPAPVDGTEFIDCVIPGQPPGAVGELRDGTPFHADEESRLFTLDDAGQMHMGSYISGLQ